eukprot:2171885-Amphidinium_carterae.2
MGQALFAVIMQWFRSCFGSGYRKAGDDSDKQCNLDGNFLPAEVSRSGCLTLRQHARAVCVHRSSAAREFANARRTRAALLRARVVSTRGWKQVMKTRRGDNGLMLGQKASAVGHCVKTDREGDEAGVAMQPPLAGNVLACVPISRVA